MKQTYRKRRRKYGGLTSMLALLLSAAVACTALCYEWAILVDLALGVSTSGAISSDSLSADSIYYQSSFGDITPLYLSASERTAEQQAELERMQAALVEAEKEFCARESEEGCVLLRNRETQSGMALPLAPGNRITLFGYAAGNPVYRSSSGSASPTVEGRTISLAQALRNNGFALNDQLQAALESTGGDRRIMSAANGKSDIGELEVNFYNSYKSTFPDYGDAAVVVLARTGGEGIDLNTTDIDGISQLALHDEEKDLLKMIKDSGAFRKTIVLIDSGYPMELGWLDDEEYGVDACLWIGNPGMYGFQGVANLLSGDANPSGHLVDTYAESSLSSPAMENFGDISYTNNGEYKYVVEAEGIYTGYKYYETRYEDCVLGNGNASDSVGSIDGQAWEYAKEVTFPFGYGLSYTRFTQKIESVEYDAGTDSYLVAVAVENVGSVPGKCAVQIYAQTPYDHSVAETASIRLVGFHKTLGTTSDGTPETAELTSREGGVLAPGERETVTVSVDRYLLTTYSERARSGQGGYVLVAGDYYLAAGENVHEALNNILAARGAEGLTDENGGPYQGDPARVYELGRLDYDENSYAASPYTGGDVRNQLTKQDINYWQEGSVTYLSRSDWKGTYPARVAVSLTDDMKREMDGGGYTASADAPAKGTYAQGTYTGVDFIDMQGIPLTGTYVDENGVEQSADEKWDAFVSQIPTDDLIANTTNRNAAVTAVNAPSASHGDGPDGIGGTLDNGQSATCYNAEIVSASSFNPKILQMRGDFEAEDSLFARFTVMWGPGANLHRTPFGGRNFEYYSECGYFGYLCASYQIGAMRAKGLITCVKHFVGNDQETNRTGVATFNNEQAWRENAMKVFEGGIARGGSLGVMTSFSLIGCTPAPSCKETNRNIMQDEWGFSGINITDSSYQMAYMDSVACIMNGTTTFCLDNRESDLKKSEGRSQYDDILGGLRQANKQFYYALVRSNASNGMAAGASVASATSWWKYALAGIDTVLAVGTALCAGMYVFCTVKGRKERSKEARNG